MADFGFSAGYDPYAMQPLTNKPAATDPNPYAFLGGGGAAPMTTMEPYGANPYAFTGAAQTPAAPTANPYQNPDAGGWGAGAVISSPTISAAPFPTGGGMPAQLGYSTPSSYPTAGGMPPQTSPSVMPYSTGGSMPPDAYAGQSSPFSIGAASGVPSAPRYTPDSYSQAVLAGQSADQAQLAKEKAHALQYGGQYHDASGALFNANGQSLQDNYAATHDNIGNFLPGARRAADGSYTFNAAPTGLGGSSLLGTQNSTQSVGSNTGLSNPYVNAQAQALTAQANQNLFQNILPQINSGAQLSGQYGGTRQGAAQGQAIGNSQTGLYSALGNLYSANYGTDQANATTQRGQTLGYNTAANSNQTTRDLGFGQLGLGYTQAGNAFALGQQQNNNALTLGLGQIGTTLNGQALNYDLGREQNANAATGQNQNFYTNQRGQDLQQYALGANLFGQGVQGNAALGAGLYNTGQQAYNAGQGALNNYGNGLSQFSGLGGGSVTTGPSNTAGNVLGGALAGNTLWNVFGGTGNTSASLNSNALANGFGNTFLQNGYSANQAYG